MNNSKTNQDRYTAKRNLNGWLVTDSLNGWWLSDERQTREIDLQIESRQEAYAIATALIEGSWSN